MRILYFNQRKGVAKLIPESIEDLYHLYFIIEKGDLVSARTVRKVKLESKDGMRVKSKAVPTTLTIRVEFIEYHEYMKSLRVGGPVVRDPRDLGIKGSHHTLNISVNEPILIEKDNWARFQLERLKKAESNRLTAKILVLAIDRDQCNIGLIGRRVEHILTLHSGIPHNKSDMSHDEAKKRFFAEIFKKVNDMLARDSISAVVVAGPGFLKEDLHRYLTNSLPSNFNVALCSASSATPSAYQEIIKSGALTKVVKKLSVIEETKIIEKLIEELSRGEKATYGIAHVEQAAKYGAIDTLLILEGVFLSPKMGIRERLDKLIETVEERGGTVKIISEGHEAANYLKSLGGIAALLRYRLD